MPSQSNAPTGWRPRHGAYWLIILPALAMLVFVLLYVPCVATLGAIKHEFGTSWAVTSAVYQTAVAWVAAFLVYQVGTLLGFV